MTKIYSYVLRYDCGAAPNPFWDVCTLTICKPVIRRNAEVGDWVIGTGSKEAEYSKGKFQDDSKKLIYAMKISEIWTLPQYDALCKISLPNKIPNWSSQDWRILMGDCIYDFSNTPEFPAQRGHFHNKGNRVNDLSGKRALLSNHFYYFGSAAEPIPTHLHDIVKRYQNHKKIEKAELVNGFEEWITSDKFEKNKIYANPQMYWKYGTQTTNELVESCSHCASHHLVEDTDETFEVI